MYRNLQHKTVSCKEPCSPVGFRRGGSLFPPPPSELMAGPFTKRPSLQTHSEHERSMYTQALFSSEELYTKFQGEFLALCNQIKVDIKSSPERFKLEKKLAAGAQGTVSRCTFDGVSCVVKQVSQENRESLQREAAFLVLLQNAYPREKWYSQPIAYFVDKAGNSNLGPADAE